MGLKRWRHFTVFTPIFPYVSFPLPYGRGPQVFQKSMSKFFSPGPRRLTPSKFHAEDPRVLSVVVQNFAAWAISVWWFVHPLFILYIWWGKAPLRTRKFKKNLDCCLMTLSSRLTRSRSLCKTKTKTLLWKVRHLNEYFTIVYGFRKL
jgi:hypothetical protein